MKRVKKALAAILFLASITTSINLVVPQAAAASGQQVDLTYHWMFQLETKELPKQFEYQGSTLKPVDKVEATYSPAKNEADKKVYEYLWYHDGKPLGLERSKKFDLPQGDGIAIRVRHNTDPSTTGEKKAVANAILRIALDAYLNKNSTSLVKLPLGSFNEISGYLQDQGMQVAPDSGGGLGGDGFGTPLASSLALYLVSEPEGLKQELYRP
jgi:hypothetical protein